MLKDMKDKITIHQKILLFIRHHYQIHAQRHKMVLKFVTCLLILLLLNNTSVVHFCGKRKEFTNCFFCRRHKCMAPKGPYHTETINFIYILNRLTGFYMVRAFCRRVCFELPKSVGWTSDTLTHFRNVCQILLLYFSYISL